jgi:YD repeat-containing protein
MLTMTNAVSRTWTYSTTPQQSGSSTPLGNTTTSTRTAYGLPGATMLPGGATTGVTHDGLTQADESSRFPLTRTDESGRERSFAYDAQSGLDSVTDLAGAAWDYDYTTPRPGASRALSRREANVALWLFSVLFVSSCSRELRLSVRNEGDDTIQDVACIFNAVSSAPQSLRSGASMTLTAPLAEDVAVNVSWVTDRGEQHWQCDAALLFEQELAVAIRPQEVALLVNGRDLHACHRT